MSSVSMSSTINIDKTSSPTFQESMDKYYNNIIDNLRLNLQMAEGRIRKLQDSEFKLESEIEILKEQISDLKKK